MYHELRKRGISAQAEAGPLICRIADRIAKRRRRADMGALIAGASAGEKAEILEAGTGLSSSYQRPERRKCIRCGGQHRPRLGAVLVHLRDQGRDAGKLHLFTDPGDEGNVD
jgi:hypothetical protein